MAQVTRSLHLKASSEEVWQLVGSFQALVDWHPAVENSSLEIIDGIEHRRLALAGGGEILERSLGFDAASYGYSIVTGPLPVSDYRAILSVTPAGEGTVVTWCSTFTPAGPDAEAAISGVYEAGLAALAERFEG